MSWSMSSSVAVFLRQSCPFAGCAAAITIDSDTRAFDLYTGTGRKETPERLHRILIAEPALRHFVQDASCGIAAAQVVGIQIAN